MQTVIDLQPLALYILVGTLSICFGLGMIAGGQR